MMIQKRRNLIAVLALGLSLLSCQSEKSKGQAFAQAEPLMAEASLTAKPAKAKVVTMFEMPAPLKDRPERILKRVGYTTSYNEQTKTPNWVAWHLTKAHTYGKNQRKHEVFAEDEDIAKDRRATNMDYYNSRYDRGHMCPAGDNKWDKEAMTQSFLFTNICPQNHGLNKYFYLCTHETRVVRK